MFMKTWTSAVNYCTSCDREQVISTTKYFNDNYQDLLNTIQDSGFNSNHVSSKELDLIIKLHQEDFHPNWNSIVTTFNERSMDQIRSILHYFNKTIPLKLEKPISLQKNKEAPITINNISMFLNPIDYTNLSMTASDIILRTKENNSASFCSIQCL